MVSSKKLDQNQHGFVSITVALFIIALITIITLSFAYLIRKEQREALDRQLSTQAYYAAESGVNDAVQALRSGSIGDISDCSGTSSLMPAVDGTNAKYTCVLIKQQPTSLVYDNQNKDESRVVHVQRAGGGNIGHIIISWEASDKDTSGFANAGTHFYLPQQRYINNPPVGDKNADFPNHAPILRATITPTSAATSTDNLLKNSQTLFLYPNGGVGIGDVSFRNPAGDESQEGLFADGKCNAANTDPNSEKPRLCNVAINVQSANAGDFYIRLRPLYKDKSSITIKAYTGADVNFQNPLALSGEQAVVDATGKAQDVLRRIQVRVPLNDTYYYPEFAVESMDTLCKRFAAWPGGSAIEAPPAYLYNSNDVLSGAERNDATKDEPACRLPGQGAQPWPSNIGPEKNY